MLDTRPITMAKTAGVKLAGEPVKLTGCQWHREGMVLTDIETARENVSIAVNFYDWPAFAAGLLNDRQSVCCPAGRYARHLVAAAARELPDRLS
jgi:hypothetical protein